MNDLYAISSPWLNFIKRKFRNRKKSTERWNKKILEVRFLYEDRVKKLKFNKQIG